MTLVDRLENVHVGDIIRLSNSQKFSVAGYLSYYATDRVTLSHQDPKGIAINNSGVVLRGFKTFSGDRTYDLKDFDTYEVLFHNKLE